ncbi:MAG: endo-1,4-beta-xylanase [Clostridia bacterium]|nr:endo-1,4-beta-xylanase [Clostridia bacterium]
MKRMTCMLLALLLSLHCTALAEEEKMACDYEPLKELARDNGFLMGAALSYNQMNDETYLNTIKHHFDTITTTNEMKAYSLLDQRASQNSPDGMPRMNYSKADQMVQFASDNGLKVRGHVLVWDAYMTKWFFHEGYDVKNPVADAETLKARMQSYIAQVMTHFETKFPGVVYCWDVVNEAIGDSEGEYEADDPSHLRTMRSGSINPFYTYVGPDYVALAFRYAWETKQALNADIRLFYNDYSMFNMKKRSAAIELVKSINSYLTDENGTPIQLCDGVGMQGYIGGYGTQTGCMKQTNLSDIKQSILAYAELGVEVQITEMAVRNYRADLEMEHGDFYRRLFKMFKAINRNQETPKLTNVAIWGMLDRPNEPKTSYGYKMNGTHGGLFGENCAVKEAFRLVHAELKAD